MSWKLLFVSKFRHVLWRHQMIQSDIKYLPIFLKLVILKWLKLQLDTRWSFEYKDIVLCWFLQLAGLESVHRSPCNMNVNIIGRCPFDWQKQDPKIWKFKMKQSTFQQVLKLNWSPNLESSQEWILNVHVSQNLDRKYTICCKFDPQNLTQISTRKSESWSERKSQVPLKSYIRLLLPLLDFIWITY